MKVRSAITMLCVFLSLSACDAYQRNPAISEQENTFEEFWSIFEQHYAFFKLHDVDWRATYQQYRSKVNGETTDEALFEMLCEMIKPFNDGHVSIQSDSLGRQCSAEPPSKVIARIRAGKDQYEGKFQLDDLINMAEGTLLTMGFKPLKQKGKALDSLQGQRVFNYSDNGQLGYIRVGRCFSTINMFDFAGSAPEMDEMLADFGDVEGIVLDARFNPGGYDAYCEAIASRFISETTLGYYRQVRNGGYEDFTDREPFYIKPRGSRPFLRPVVLLTNDETASAADVLALVMTQFPHVTLMGENSAGIFSTVLTNRLQNGWQVNLSNQRYTSVDGIDYESTGVPVDIEAFNTTEDFVNGNDRVIRRAIEYLSRTTREPLQSNGQE